MLQISDRAQSIQPSATIAMAARARELIEQGIDLISLTLGEPDFTTPQHICGAAVKAIKAGFTHYPAVDGIAELKQAIINKLQRDNQLEYQANEILISVGAKHSIYNLMQATLNPGDEVIIPAPYWVSYPDMTTLTGAKPVIINADIKQNFKINAKQLAAAINDKTRMLILNSPSNPTGAAYTKKELQALAEILLQHPNVIILSDDIYEHIYWASEPFCNIAMVCPDLKDRTFVINGVSKAYAMTGWRIGYLAGPEEIVKQAKKIQSQSTSAASGISQKAATEALDADQQCVRDMTKEFKTRHDYFIPALNAISGIKVRPAEGAFYAFIDVSEIIANTSMQDDLELGEYFLNEAHVAMVAGSAFGLKNHLRLSYATSMDLLEGAIQRIDQALRKLK